MNPSKFIVGKGGPSGVRSLSGYRLAVKAGSWLARIFGEEEGQVLPWVAGAMVAMLASSALAIDVAHGLVAKHQLQLSTDSAALAAAGELPKTDYSTVGQTYGGGSGGKNANGTITLTNITITPLCLSTVRNWGIFCASQSGTVTVPNAVQVKETANVSTFFAGLVGVRQFTITTTATASKGKPKSYNIAVIVDSTLSMNQTDSNCGNITSEACALNGVKQLLLGLSTSWDRVALFTFPNVATGSSAGVAYNGSYTCTSAIPSSNGSVSYPNQSPYGNYVVLDNPNYSSGYGRGWGSGSSQPKYLLPWSGAAWDMPYTFPPIPSSTSGYTVASGTYAPTYEVVPFSADYNSVNSSGVASLNTSSNLVKAVGGNSSCGGIIPGNYDGNYGTYYAGAIYAAQAALLAEQASNPQSGNVIIVLGDGNSTAPSSSSSPDSSSPAMPSSSTQSTTTYGTSSALTTSAYTFPSSYKVATSNGSYPSWAGECGQAVDAAQYASTYPSDSSNGTLVYAIAYGALTTSSSGQNGGCASDIRAGNHPNITPCQTMQQMATNSTSSSTSNYFYSDYTAQGATSGCAAAAGNSGTTAINQIFQSITTDLTGARLLPNDTQ